MSKFSKVIMILAGCLFGIGVLFTIVAFFMGANVYDIRKVGNSTIFDISFRSDSESKKESGALLQMSSFKGIQNISIDIGASSIEISYAEVDQVEVCYEDAVGMNMEVDEGELEIECRASGNVEILVPKETTLNEIDLNIGAGRVLLQEISFRNLDADVGAGELVVYTPEELDTYHYSVDCALGEVCIGDETYTGISSTEKNRGAQKAMDIDCGAGRVEVQFAE